MGKPWTDKEKDILIEKYPILSSKEISAKYLPTRTPTQITEYANKKLKLKKDSSYKNQWSESQIDYLKENYKNPDISLEYISRIINKSKSTITQMANSIGLHRESKWSEKDREIISLHYPTTPTEELQKDYFKDKTLQQIISFANRNGISKTEEFRMEQMTKVGLENLKCIPDLSGENHPKWEQRFEVNCAYCDNLIKKTMSKLNKSKNHFCNYKCMGNWMSENNIGEMNNNYGNGDAWTEEMRLSSAKRSVERLIKSDFAFTQTKPEYIISELLDSLAIKHYSEYDCKYYLIDKYLPDHNLMIEIQGNFYHCNPTMNLLNKRANKIIRKDKSKNTYVKKYKGVNILYLWEKDILENKELCTKLIEHYIESNGTLENYHSFNYTLEHNELKLISELYSVGY